VDGESLETKKHIGYLPESNPLYVDMFVREYLHFVGELHQVASLKERIQEVIGLVGLTPESHKQIAQLSKGYKQRVGLAAALIHDPSVLILDEPTTGLDPNQIKEIRDVIKELGKSKTILFSTHIMQEVEAICDRVIVINKGAIVADDQLSVLTAGNQKTLVRVQFSGEIDLELIKKLPNLIKIDRLDGISWEIQAEDADKLGKELMSFALQHNLNIVSLQTQTRRLEDIFSELTGKTN
jgi:ABC-2 type transport system ATP-binding protein